MSVSGLTFSARRLAAVLLIGALPLVACERRPDAPSAYSPSAAEPPAATELAGAPAGGGGVRSPGPETAPPPPPPEALAAPEPAPPPRASRGDEVVYDLGPVVPAPAATAPAAAPAVRAEAVAPAPARRTAAHARRTHHAVAARPVAPKASPVARTASAPTPMRRTRPATPPPAQLRKAEPAPVPVARRAAATPAAKPATPAPVAAPTKAPVEAKAVPTPSTAAKPVVHARTKATSRSAVKAADHAAKLTALQAALREAVTANGVLSVPSLPADRPGDVTLTLPAEFSALVRTEAEKQGLADAAASVNLTAALSGDGYAIMPDATQSQPLTVGQPTVFRWTATAQPGPRSALRADVGADLLGGGSETLVLGAIEAQPKSSGFSSRALGAGLLALIAVLVVAWLARVRRTPAQQEHRRRSAQRERNGIRGERPFDMTNGDRRP